MARRGKRGGAKQAARAAAHSVAREAAEGQASELEAVRKVRDVLASAGFDGANVSSPRRGTIHWSRPESKRELSPGARREIMRKAHWAYANIGLVKRVIDGMTNLIGYQTPQSVAADAELYERAWQRRAMQPAAFDVAAKLNAESWQRALTRCRLLDGDCLTVLTEGSTGGARIAFYEAIQVDDGAFRGTDKPDDLFDGVFIDRMGRHKAYNLLENMGSDEERATRVPASRAIYHANEAQPGRVRGVSALAHALSNLVDIVEILADTKHAVKIAAQWGVVLESSSAVAGGGSVTPELAQFLGADTVGTNDDAESQELLVDDIVQGGRMQSMPSGTTAKTLQDTRPHPNQMDLIRFLIRDVCWGAGLAPEVMYESVGLSGTATRYVMAETRRWIECQQSIQRMACNRLWGYFIAKEVKAGRLPQPSDDRWLEVEWVPQADMTIDRGRDTAAMLQMLDKGLISRSEIIKSRGGDFKQVADQLRAEEEYLAGAGLMNDGDGG